MVEEKIDWGFACPQSGFNRSVLEFVVTDHTQQVVDRFLDLRRDELGHQAPGIAELLTDWLGTAATFDTVWDVSFGDLYATCSSGSGDLTEHAGAVALRLSERGFTGEWEAHFERPTRLRFGRWLLPTADAHRVEADSSTVKARLHMADRWRTVTYDRDECAWDDPHVGEVPVIGGGVTKLAVLGAEALSAACAGRLLTADAYDFDLEAAMGADGWAPTCEAALALISQAADDYLQWVRTILRVVVPLRAKAGTLNSGSDRFSPGAICVSNQQRTWFLAEMLVHEATHQYLHVASRLGALDDGSDHRLYFSPFRNKDRPIVFILVAYHAFGNVLLFYRSARERGMVPPDDLPVDHALANREDTLERQLAQIEPVLRNATSLTPFGRALWEPLSEQIHPGGV